MQHKDGTPQIMTFLFPELSFFFLRHPSRDKSEKLNKFDARAETIDSAVHDV